MSEVVPAAPAADVSAPSGEPTIESLTALVPDGNADAADAANIAAKAEAAEVPADPAEAPAEAVEPAPAEDTGALERAEQAAKKAREGSRRFRELQAAQQRQAEAAAQQARLMAEYRAQAEEAKKLRDLLLKDPYAALKELGMTDQDLAERALREGTPEAAMHALRQEFAAERKRIDDLHKSLEREKFEVARQNAELGFTKVADNEVQFPRLAQLDSSRQLSIARTVLQQIAANGYDTRGLSDEQVAEACERFLAPKKGAATKPAPAPAPAPKPAGKTLTNAMAQTRAVAPKAWDELSDEEQIAQLAASIPDAT